MKALQRKLSRDLWHLRGQVLAIAVVIGGGVAPVIMALSIDDREIVASKTSPEVHSFQAGDRLVTILNGRCQALENVGVALSPEYISLVKPGDLFPDFKCYSVLWMNRTPLATGDDMEGVFSDLVLPLTRDVRASDAFDQVDIVFPFLDYPIRLQGLATGTFVTIAAGLIGALSPVRRCVRLPPAEAMRREPPWCTPDADAERSRAGGWSLST